MNLSDTVLLLTRPEPGASRLAGQIRDALGAAREVIVSPLMEIVPLPADLPAGTGAEIVLSSENALRALAGRFDGQGRAAWCVGARTARAAAAAGFRVRAVAPDLAGLAAELAHAGIAGPVLHLGGRHRAGDLAGRLQPVGIAVQALAVYDQQALPLSAAAEGALQGDRDVVAPLFSPLSAALLAGAAVGRRAPLHVAAISPAAAAAWAPRPGERVEIAATPDAAGVIAAMGRLFDAERHA